MTSGNATSVEGLHDHPAARTRPAFLYGAGRDLEHTVTTHLFGICPNNSGSTFLVRALEACRATWGLPREGQWMRGFRGPVAGQGIEDRRLKLLWACGQSWLRRFADPAGYDWPRTRKAWYAQAYARDPAASVFVSKSPPHLLCVGELVRHFRNARFLFMVRNPYAVCEGIVRACEMLGRLGLLDGRHGSRVHGMPLPEAAAAHVVNCLAWQRRNLETGAYRERGVFFTYEEMCAAPERVASSIRALAPELDDLDLRRRLPVKNTYNEMLTDMNARQIARLDAGRIEAFNRVFRARRDVLDYFGYDLMAASRASR